jgi:hypothetical protein
VKEGEKEPEVGGLPPLPPGMDRAAWFRKVRMGVRDLGAVTKDRLRRKRKRDLGIREAKRLYDDAWDTLVSLLALDDGRDEDEPSG